MTAFNIKYFPSQSLRLAFDAGVETTGFIPKNGILHLVNPAAPLNVQLPDPATVGANFHCVIKDLSGDLSANTITLVRNGTEKIDNVAANYIMRSGNQAITIMTNGADWFII